MKEITYHSRKFLNKKIGMAAIECDVSINDHSIYASSVISDCNRQVSLDFTAYNVKDLDAKLTKLGLLINELFEMEQFLLEHKFEWTEELKKGEQARRANKKKRRSAPLNIGIDSLEI